MRRTLDPSPTGIDHGSCVSVSLRVGDATIPSNRLSVLLRRVAARDVESGDNG